MRHRIKKSPMAQINVVPYIDVMLVLLIIFMVTAPLITQGVKVDLPVTSADKLAAEDVKPLVITIKENGELYLNQHSTADKPLPRIELSKTVSEIYQKNPKMPVLVRGDKNASHGLVTEIMAQLQIAGIQKIGIVTQARHK